MRESMSLSHGHQCLYRRDHHHVQEELKQLQSRVERVEVADVMLTPYQLDRVRETILGYFTCNATSNVTYNATCNVTSIVHGMFCARRLKHVEWVLVLDSWMLTLFCYLIFAVTGDAVGCVKQMQSAQRMPLFCASLSCSFLSCVSRAGFCRVRFELCAQSAAL